MWKVLFLHPGGWLQAIIAYRRELLHCGRTSVWHSLPCGPLQSLHRAWFVRKYIKHQYTFLRCLLLICILVYFIQLKLRMFLLRLRSFTNVWGGSRKHISRLENFKMLLTNHRNVAPPHSVKKNRLKTLFSGWKHCFYKKKKIQNTTLIHWPSDNDWW